MCTRYTTSHMFGLLVRRGTTRDGRGEEHAKRNEKEPTAQTDIKTIKHLSLYWCMEWIWKLFFVLSCSSPLDFIKWKMIRLSSGIIMD